MRSFPAGGQARARRRRTPTIAAACASSRARPGADGNAVAQRNEGQRRIRQAAQDRQPHPGIIRVLRCDRCQGHRARRALRGSDCRAPAPLAGGHGSRDRRPAWPASAVEMSRSWSRGLGHGRDAQGVLAQCRVRVVERHRFKTAAVSPFRATKVQRAWSRARGLVLSLSSIRST